MEGATARMMKDFEKKGLTENNRGWAPPKKEDVMPIGNPSAEEMAPDPMSPFGQVKVEIQTDTVPTPEVKAPRVYTGSGGYTYQVNPDSTIEILTAPKAEQQGLKVKATGRNAKAYAAIAQELIRQDEALAPQLAPMIEAAKKAASAPTSPSAVRVPSSASKPPGAVGTVAQGARPEMAAPDPSSTSKPPVEYPAARQGATSFVLSGGQAPVETPPASTTVKPSAQAYTPEGDPILQSIAAREAADREAAKEGQQIGTQIDQAAREAANRTMQAQVDAEKAARSAGGFRVTGGKYAGTEMPPGSRDTWETLLNTRYALWDRTMRNYKEYVSSGMSNEDAWKRATANLSL